MDLDFGEVALSNRLEKEAWPMFYAKQVSLLLIIRQIYWINK